MCVLRLSLKTRSRARDGTAKRETNVIICICRGKSDTDVKSAIGRGATTLRDLQRCGMGDQCGSCHASLRTILAAAAAEAAARQPQPCPSGAPAAEAVASASA